jgi:hypothetical protein
MNFNNLTSNFFLILFFTSGVVIAQDEEQPCEPIVTDQKQYTEVVDLIKNIENQKISYTPWRGPCKDDPNLNAPFQSNYELSGYGYMPHKRGELYRDARPYKIENDCLLFQINYGGGYEAKDECNRREMLIWDGIITRDDQNRLVINLVFSFKNRDIRRAGVYERKSYDLTSLGLNTMGVGQDEKVYIRIEGYPDLIQYNQ